MSSFPSSSPEEQPPSTDEVEGPEHEQLARRELILYATPLGDLARACEHFFATLERAGHATTAQTYPPHVTLTGFFHRPSSAVPRILDDVRSSIAATTVGSVDVRSLLCRDGWVGLEIESEWLLDVARAFDERHTLSRGDDPIRLKTWLHLSLAYGNLSPELGIDEYHERARETVDPNASASWTIGLWERKGSDWIQLESER